MKLLPPQLSVPSPPHVAKRIDLVADAVRANRCSAELAQARDSPQPPSPSAQPPSLPPALPLPVEQASRSLSCTARNIRQSIDGQRKALASGQMSRSLNCSPRNTRENSGSPRQATATPPVIRRPPGSQHRRCSAPAVTVSPGSRLIAQPHGHQWPEALAEDVSENTLSSASGHTGLPRLEAPSSSDTDGMVHSAPVDACTTRTTASCLSSPDVKGASGAASAAARVRELIQDRQELPLITPTGPPCRCVLVRRLPRRQKRRNRLRKSPDRWRQPNKRSWLLPPLAQLRAG